jgi:hypothetical protein
MLSFHSYITIVRKPVRLLKAHQYIASHIDVAESLLSCLKEPPPAFDALSLKDVSDMSFMDIQLAVLRHYLCWRLEMKPDELDFIMKTYCRLKHRSFRLVEKSLKILEEVLGFSKEKVCFVVITIIFITIITTTTTIIIVIIGA